MKKLLPVIAALALFAACVPSQRENYTVILSLDAFRWDYPDLYDTPWLDSIARCGVKSTMLPSYPASTFPNHYTLATGLVPDHHGIVNNSFWDEASGMRYAMGDIPTRNNTDYYGGEPIWTTAEKQGVRTGSLYWVGSDIPIKESLPSIYRYWYDEPRLDYSERAEEAVRLLSLPEEERPHLLMVYMDDPDAVSHEFGPKSIETGIMVHYLDSLVGIMYRGFKALPYGDKINFIVTADHGMTDISPDRFYRWDDYLKSEWYSHIEATNPTNIYCNPGCRDSVITALSGLEHLNVWKKEEVPAELNYGSSERVGDVVAAADLGWQFAAKPSPNMGAHGYFPQENDMQVSFRACGPGFKKGFENPDKFLNVDVYPLLAHLLGIKPEATDGDFSRVEPLLSE